MLNSSENKSLQNVVPKQERNDVQEDFDRLLKNKFEDFKNGSFVSSLPGIDRINIIKGPASPANGDVGNLFVMPYFKFTNKSGKVVDGHITITLMPSGVLSVDNREFRKLGSKVSRDDILKEVLHITETVDLDFFENVDENILPPDDFIIPEGQGTETKRRPEKTVDPRRIKFMREQPEILFGFTGMNTGFRGYMGFVFSDFMVLVNQRIGNALYFYEFEESIEVDDQRFKLPPSMRLTSEERQKILDEKWGPVSGLTKSEFRKKGAQQKYNPQQVLTDEDWASKMEEEIEKRQVA